MSIFFAGLVNDNLEPYGPVIVNLVDDGIWQ